MIENPSDRNYACFVCSDFITKDKGGTCEKCGSPMEVGEEIVGVKIAGRTLTEFKGRGFYGLTFKCESAIGIPAAIKLIPKKLYSIREKNFGQEIQKYVQLRSHQNIARLDDAGEASIQVQGQSVDIHFILMEWIEGKTLREFYETEDVSCTDVYSVCTQVSDALSRFESFDLVHNDLNADNIMVSELSDDELGSRIARSRIQVKLIDTGSAVYKEAQNPDKIDDLYFLGQHITALVKSAYKENGATVLEEQNLLDSLNNLAGQLRDEDPSRRIGTASAFSERVREAYESRRKIKIEIDETLKSPFAYLNALDFKDNSTLVGRLFNDEFPWIRQSIMSSAQQVLITGPRGCGKTMILKNMRLRTKLLSSSIEPSPEGFGKLLAQIDFLGFFISARVEIGNYLLTQKLAEWAQSEENIVCKFQLLYALEVIETLVLIKTHYKVEFDLDAELKICALLNIAMNRDSRTLTEALSDIRRTIQEIRQSQFAAEEATSLLSGGFLKSLCSSVEGLHPAFEGKSFNFLLDDFSAPKIPASIQRSLLPLIWAPGEGYFFKVSAHSKSVESEDNRGVTYNEQRDYAEVNLGKEYIDFTTGASGKTTAHRAIRNIISRRFALSDSEEFKDFDFDPVAILGRGESRIAENLAKASKSGKAYQYKGWQTILALCSGEISFVLDIFSKLYESHDKGAAYPISTQIQNRTIKELSKGELVQLQSKRNLQSNLYLVAKAFGDMSRVKLLGPEVKDGDKTRLAEYTRMEIDLQEQDETARSAMNELISNGVFIDGGLSSSSRGSPTQRLLFRRLFTPAFPTTWNNRDGFNWTQKRFLQFIANPDEFAKSEKLKSTPGKDTPLLDGL